MRWLGMALVLSTIVLALGCGFSEGDEASGSTTGPDENPLTGDPLLPSPPDELPPSVPWRDFVGSGTRLKAEVAQTGDITGFLGWHDSELDADCRFMPTAEGMRCLFGGEAVYLDGPNCDEPFFPVGWEQPPDYLLFTREGNCATEYEVFRVTETEQTPNPDCFQGGDGSPPEALRVLSPVDVGIFVGASFSVTTDAGYSDHRMDAEDGAWAILGPAHDANPCSGRQYDATEVCLDVEGLNTRECDSKVVTCGPAHHVITWDDCGLDVTNVRELAEGQDAVLVCGDETYAGGWAHVPGSTLGAPDLPALNHTLLGQERVRMLAISSEQGELTWPRELRPGQASTGSYDTKYGVLCSDDDDEEGVVRCLPAEVGFPDQSYFADPNCSLPAYLGAFVGEGPEACEFAWIPENYDPVFGWVESEDGVRDLHGVVEIEGPVYVGGPGACVEGELPYGVQRAFEPAGGKVPLDLFAESSRSYLP
jgi:hypothetical protein